MTSAAFSSARRDGAPAATDRARQLQERGKEAAVGAGVGRHDLDPVVGEHAPRRTGRQRAAGEQHVGHQNLLSPTTCRARVVSIRFS